MDKKTSTGNSPSLLGSLETAGRTLGPVEDLEEHVRADWWRSIFNSLYLKTDADVVDDHALTQREVDMILETLNLTEEQRILDLCCGQGRHALELSRRGFGNIEGLDRSHYLIQRAKKQAQKEGLNVKFREGDARKLPYPPDAFDAVMILGNSFGYFETVQDDLRVLKEVYRVLKPWGKLVIDAADGEHLREHFQPRSWEWIGRKHFVCRERSLSRDGQRLISREVINHVEKGVIADQFYAERLYTDESLLALLKEVGLRDVKFHCRPSTGSRRNQDLGMMERRIIVSALVRKEWTPIRRRPDERTRNVVVVFGDPLKPDPVKPGALFDDDDFYTIDQLKAALEELKEYRFTYLNNHETLVHDLMSLKAKTDLVFNLCDEGYGNDPQNEAHIPALLEIMRIPYSGANPQCLAYCYDKSLIRGIARELGIAVPEACFIKPDDTAFELPFDLPGIVKPNFGDSSFGITRRSVVGSLEELTGIISETRERFGYEKPILVEEFLTGKDLTVGIIGNPLESYTILPIIEEDYSSLPIGLPKICGYEAKWDPDSPYWNLKPIPAELPDQTREFIIECCLKLFERVECRDYSRFDWRLDSRGKPKLLEVNPNPGWCWDGHLAKAANLAGMSYSQMVGAILHAVEQRLKTGAANGREKEDQSSRAIHTKCIIP